MSSACSTCAKCGGACCKNGETYLTAGDVQRIAGHTQRLDFHFLRPMGPDYQDADPAWRDQVCDLQGRRRVLRRSDDGSCTFLSETGCVLPVDVRPLLCRIYPYDFDSEKLLGPSPGCPIARQTDKAAILVGLGMSPGRVRHWHRTLHSEIALEKSTPSGG